MDPSSRRPGPANQPDHADLIVVGAGIVGLAHALAGAERGWRVIVVDRDHRCVGASIRNFGFVTVTGQPAGDTWRRARFARDVWARVCPQAGIPVEHRGLWVSARRPSAVAVLQAFMATDMASENQLLDGAEAARRVPALRIGPGGAAMYSPHELRVESRRAIPSLTEWLAKRHGVRFLFGEAVTEVRAPSVRTVRRELHAERVVVCPGTDLTGIAWPHVGHHRLRLTRLQMLRVRTDEPLTLGAAMMSELSLVRYGGYAALPQAAALRHELGAEFGETLAAGIHLIAVQSSDGSLVVGDSHHDDDTPDPFASEAIDHLILQELGRSLRIGGCRVVERWTGVYPVGAGADCVIESPDDATRVVIVTSGTGASTAFGIADDVLRAW